MAEKRTSRDNSSKNGDTVGYEQQLWQVADPSPGSDVDFGPEQGDLSR
jgi:hypothetical protein